MFILPANPSPVAVVAEFSAKKSIADQPISFFLNLGLCQIARDATQWDCPNEVIWLPRRRIGSPSLTLPSMEDDWSREAIFLIRYAYELGGELDLPAEMWDGADPGIAIEDIYTAAGVLAKRRPDLSPGNVLSFLAEALEWAEYDLLRPTGEQNEV